MLVSSAYMEVFEFLIASGRSLIYMRNRRGPKHYTSHRYLLIETLKWDVGVESLIDQLRINHFNP